MTGDTLVFKRTFGVGELVLVFAEGVDVDVDRALGSPRLLEGFRAMFGDAVAEDGAGQLEQQTAASAPSDSLKLSPVPARSLISKTGRFLMERQGGYGGECQCLRFV